MLWKNYCHSLGKECVLLSIFSISVDTFLDGDIQIFLLHPCRTEVIIHFGSFMSN